MPYADDDDTWGPKSGTLRVQMGLDELIDGLHALLEDHEAARGEDPGEGNYGCEDCVACYTCRFCVACDSCEDCTYCEECVECTGCTQSKRCLACERCSYSEDSRSCGDSRYLTLCIECRDCTHCLGCVGLKDAEFHVLNEKVPRKEYYELLKRVREAIVSRMASGWRPEAIGLEAPPEPEPEPADELDNLEAVPDGLLGGLDTERDDPRTADDDDPWLDESEPPGAGARAADSADSPRQREAATRDRPSLVRGGRPARSEEGRPLLGEDDDEPGSSAAGRGLRRGRRPSRS